MKPLNAKNRHQRTRTLTVSFYLRTPDLISSLHRNVFNKSDDVSGKFSGQKFNDRYLGLFIYPYTSLCVLYYYFLLKPCCC